MFDRQRGALIGLAVGDALGAAVEFMPPRSFAPVTDYRGGGPHGLRPGEWTDDTAFYDAESFEQAVLQAVNLGDDADTTGAVCGQLAGAYWGESSIPPRLRSGLARMDLLEKAVDGIVTVG